MPADSPRSARPPSTCTLGALAPRPSSRRLWRLAALGLLRSRTPCRGARFRALALRWIGRDGRARRRTVRRLCRSSTTTRARTPRASMYSLSRLPPASPPPLACARVRACARACARAFRRLPIARRRSHMRCCAHSAPDRRSAARGGRGAADTRGVCRAGARSAQRRGRVRPDAHARRAAARRVLPAPASLRSRRNSACACTNCRGRQRGSRSRRGWCGTARGVHSAYAALRCAARARRSYAPAVWRNVCCAGTWPCTGSAPCTRTTPSTCLRSSRSSARRSCGTCALRRSSRRHGLPLARVLTAYSQCAGGSSGRCSAGW
jgi:hypothetical protein